MADDLDTLAAGMMLVLPDDQKGRTVLFFNRAGMTPHIASRESFVSRWIHSNPCGPNPLSDSIIFVIVLESDSNVILHNIGGYGKGVCPEKRDCLDWQFSGKLKIKNDDCLASVTR